MCPNSSSMHPTPGAACCNTMDTVGEELAFNSPRTPCSSRLIALKQTYPYQHQTSTTGIGTTAIHTVATSTTITPVQCTPNQDQCTNLTQPTPTQWTAQQSACTRQSCPLSEDVPTQNASTNADHMLTHPCGLATAFATHRLHSHDGIYWHALANANVSSNELHRATIYNFPLRTGGTRPFSWHNDAILRPIPLASPLLTVRGA